MEVKQSIEKAELTELTTLVIRVPKEEAAMTYFTLEANEGLCFYSTLKESLGKGHRDIQINIPRGFESEVDSILNGLQQHYPIERLGYEQNPFE